MSRVLWDGRFVGQHGIARFASEVYTRLEEKPVAWTTNRWAPYSLQSPFETALVLRKRRALALVSPSYAATVPGPYRQILTIHDLIYLDVAVESSPKKRLFFNRLVAPAIRNANVVMTVSEFSKRRIAEWSGLPLDSVVVVGNGCSMPLLGETEDAGHAGTHPYILFVGNERPHKNFPLLLRARKRLDPALGLVTVGLSADYLAAECKRAGVDPKTISAHHSIDDEYLRNLYTNAACLAVPSTYEGFGLIAVEAAARGVATAYCCEAVGEVVGDLGARAVDTDDAEAYAVALADAIGITGTRKPELVARAATFRWSDVAARVDTVIRTSATS